MGSKYIGQLMHGHAFIGYAESMYRPCRVHVHAMQGQCTEGVKIIESI